MSATGAVVVLSTVGTRADAERLAREVVDRRVAACVNVLPGLVSFYRWKGEVARDEEFLLLAKTTAGGLARLQETLLELHPYEVPEVLAVPVEAGHGAYLAWLAESVGAP